MTRRTNEAKVLGSNIEELTTAVVSDDFASKITENLSHIQTVDLSVEKHWKMSRGTNTGCHGSTENGLERNAMTMTAD